MNMEKPNEKLTINDFPDEILAHIFDGENANIGIFNMASLFLVNKKFHSVINYLRARKIKEWKEWKEAALSHYYSSYNVDHYLFKDLCLDFPKSEKPYSLVQVAFITGKRDYLDGGVLLSHTFFKTVFHSDGITKKNPLYEKALHQQQQQQFPNIAQMYTCSIPRGDINPETIEEHETMSEILEDNEELLFDIDFQSLTDDQIKGLFRIATLNADVYTLRLMIHQLDDVFSDDILLVDAKEYYIKFICYEASLHGRIDILQPLLLNNNNYRDIFYKYYDDENTRTCGRMCMDIAARNGQFDCVVFMRTKMHVYFYQDTCDHPSDKGHFDIVEWYIQNKAGDGNKLFTNALKYGHMEMVKLLFKKEYINYVSMISEYAPQSGNLDLLKWLHDNGCRFDADACDQAVRSGNFDMVKWIRQIAKAPLTTRTLIACIETNRFDMLKWCKENCTACNELACAIAAKEKQYDMLKWLVEKGAPYDSKVTACIARNGNLQMLKWCNTVGIPMDRITTEFAANSGNFEILEWCMTECNIPWDFVDCSKVVETGNLESVKYVVQKIMLEKENPDSRYKFAISAEIYNFCAYAAKEGHFEILQWLVNNGLRCDDTAASYAAIYGHLDMLKWMQQRAGVILTDDVFHRAIKGKRYEIVKWLIEGDRIANSLPLKISSKTKKELFYHGDFVFLQWANNKSIF